MLNQLNIITSEEEETTGQLLAKEKITKDTLTRMQNN